MIVIKLRKRRLIVRNEEIYFCATIRTPLKGLFYFILKLGIIFQTTWLKAYSATNKWNT